MAAFVIEKQAGRFAAKFQGRRHVLCRKAVMRGRGNGFAVMPGHSGKDGVEPMATPADGRGVLAQDISVQEGLSKMMPEKALPHFSVMHGSRIAGAEIAETLLGFR